MTKYPLSVLVGLSLCALYGSAQAAAPLPICAGAFEANKYDVGKQWTMLAGQGKDGWLFSVANLLPYDPTLGKFQNDITRFRDELAKRGTELITVSVPPRAATMNQFLDPKVPVFKAYNAKAEAAKYAAYVKLVNSLGIYSPNALDIAYKNAGQFNFFFARDHHWTPQAAGKVAEAMAAYIKTRPAYKDLPKVPFKLVSKPFELAGSYAKLVQDICQVTLPKEKTTTFEAVRVNPIGLLDDETPQVVLVGTSHSNTGAFAESLSYTLQTPVLNAALDGGGARAAMETYFHSADFRRAPPKFLIWELEDTLLQYNFYSQMIPTLKGPCAAKPLPLFFVGAGAKVRVPQRPAVGDYLTLTLPDLSVRSLRLAFVSGGRVVANSVVERPRVAQNDGVFYFELPQNLKYDTVNISSLYTGKASFQMCKG